MIDPLSVQSILEQILSAARAAEDTPPMDDDCPTNHSVDDDCEDTDPIIPHDDLDTDEG